jgi:hypothetical protein
MDVQAAAGRLFELIVARGENRALRKFHAAKIVRCENCATQIRKVKWCARKVAQHSRVRKNEVMCDFSSHTTSLSYIGSVHTKFGFGFAYANDAKIGK